MPNRLADAISPYLRSHADNPVDWHGWGEEAFAEARARDLPLLVSIGYSTCHWCHVMARESFSDPDLAAYLNAHFVSIKVDREEHPEVDATYLAAASAFVDGLGWPLNVFVTPEGRAFYAGTYFPPIAVPGRPAFRQVLEAVTDAWTARRAEVTETGALVADALAAAARQQEVADAAVADAAVDGVEGDGDGDGLRSLLPQGGVLDGIVAGLAATEDTRHGGFGGAPKFPVAPALGFLLDRPAGRDLALRTLKRMGASPLRDSVEGGFFRYAVNGDWSEPHFERMLYDNAQLLEVYTQAWKLTGEQWARTVAEGVAGFLLSVMQLPDGGFASAQDSESTVAGRRVEGGYYALDIDARRTQPRPALDEKVLTGWNGLAIAALARAGFAFDEPRYTDAAARAADYLLSRHLTVPPAGDPPALVRASIAGRISTARATLEDFGMFARGLLELALVTGEERYASAARLLVDSTLAPTTDTVETTETVTTGTATTGIAVPDTAATTDPAATRFRVPAGSDPVLVGQGLALEVDPSEGAYPSGRSAAAGAAQLLYLLTESEKYRDAAVTAVVPFVARAAERPLAFGAVLQLCSALPAPVEQLVIVSPDSGPVATSPDEGALDERRPPGELLGELADLGGPDHVGQLGGLGGAVDPDEPGEPDFSTAPSFFDVPAAVSVTALVDRARQRSHGVVASVTANQARALAAAGFDLFAGRAPLRELPTAYLCQDFVCRVPVTDPAELTIGETSAEIAPDGLASP
ncbi:MULTISPECIES: thioredoxin domain-containing protein [unclassified Cryobacterium]|uniref:thioredoxin domain-containing protein n=1 Tax=unclassified Cryobacterium TaxID=2649013 RepID=UPI002AB59B8E|nr:MULTISPECIES: DUF255 domain-containing protein [unclassified Cryobacterium]MDY7541226.1 DUF255 domain-containing protein [Cryobacterium sp. 5B3]MEA9999961.1 DUF255 domain-containing protein [Cryobacterium sp. RTS3]MEB0266714.1 DUF255 domain-containing protein [Cryobacterium sp. 10I5]MEB0275915.1 DUF255 domain-containing protein [Cryobacterium sp. 5B3]